MREFQNSPEIDLLLSLPDRCALDFCCRQGSNPLKMGVPKRVPSLNTQVEGKCRELGGINAIHRCEGSRTLPPVSKMLAACDSDKASTLPPGPVPNMRGDSPAVGNENLYGKS